MSTIPAGFAELSWHFSFDGTTHESVTTMGVDLVDVVTIPDVNEAMTIFGTNFSSVIGSSVDLTRCIARIGTDDEPLVVESTEDVIHMAGGATLPPQCAFLVKKLTAFGGRKNRGRMFIPGANDNLVDDAGNLTDTGVTDLAAAAVGLRSDLVGTDWVTECVILHTSALVAPTVITALLAETKIATQRRRLR